MKKVIWIPLLIGVSGLAITVSLRGEESVKRTPRILRPGPAGGASSDSPRVKVGSEAGGGEPRHERIDQPAPTRTPSSAMEIYRRAVGSPLDEEHLRDLENILIHNESAIREWSMALWALSRFDTPESLAILHRYASTPTAPVSRRTHVVKYLGGAKEPAAVPALVELTGRGLEDPVALASVQTLLRRSSWDPVSKKQLETLAHHSVWGQYLATHSPSVRRSTP